MRARRDVCRVLVLSSFLLAGISAVAAAEAPRSRLSVSLSLEPPQIRGRIESTFTNTGAAPLHELVLMLFANRFSTPDTGVDDANRQFVYPGQDFVAGGIEVGGIRVGDDLVHTEALDAPDLPAGCGLRLVLASVLPPGETVRVSAEFTTRLPTRFGTFGEFEEMLTALGGWYPSLAALRADGTWGLQELPPLSDFEVELAADRPLEVLLNGSYTVATEAPQRISVDGVHYLTLVAAPELLRQIVVTGDTRIVHYRRPPVRSDRICPGCDTQEEIMRATLQEIVQQRPPGVPAPSGELVVVEVPLRLYLTAPGEGMVVISDRSLDVLWLLRPFHQAQMAQASYAEILRPTLVAREPLPDTVWVSEGLSYEQARSYFTKAHVDTTSVQDWIELFNIFAIVDRFETAPKIPFVGAFFEREPTVDPLHEQISTYNNDLPAGHVVLGKLHQLVGDETFQRIVVVCTGATTAFRLCAAQESGRNLDDFFAEWLQPYPRINYSLADVELNQREGEDFVDHLTVQRASSRPIREPVEVELRSLGGNVVHLRWDGAGDAGTLSARAPFRVQQAIVDPKHKLIETTRVDNADPPVPQIILDTAEVEVSSTEFGFSALAVARARGDYRKDLAAAGVYNNRGVGVAVGGRYHWGEAIDAAAYRNNIFAFYAVQALDKSFRNDSQPGVRTSGHVNGIGLRYDYDNILSYDNPTREVQLQLFTDVFDRALGSDYDYVDWGGGLVLTHPLWSNRTILAGQVFNGFSEPLGSSSVPNQGLYSLGGSRSIRGIGAEEELARNIFLLRGELRQTLYPELDLNFLDLLVLRHIQMRGFVDTGEVSNSAGAIYNPAHYAVGIGLGFGLVYDFMGFFPSIAYFEVATRVDGGDAGDVQFLFGTRQSF